MLAAGAGATLTAALVLLEGSPSSVCFVDHVLIHSFIYHLFISFLNKYAYSLTLLYLFINIFAIVSAFAKHLISATTTATARTTLTHCLKRERRKNNQVRSRGNLSGEERRKNRARISKN
jgi:hypothetical protein